MINRVESVQYNKSIESDNESNKSPRVRGARKIAAAAAASLAVFLPAGCATGEAVGSQPLPVPTVENVPTETAPAVACSEAVDINVVPSAEYDIATALNHYPLTTPENYDQIAAEIKIPVGSTPAEVVEKFIKVSYIQAYAGANSQRYQDWSENPMHKEFSAEAAANAPVYQEIYSEDRTPAAQEYIDHLVEVNSDTLTRYAKACAIGEESYVYYSQVDANTELVVEENPDGSTDVDFSTITHTNADAESPAPDIAMQAEWNDFKADLSISYKDGADGYIDITDVQRHTQGLAG